MGNRFNELHLDDAKHIDEIVDTIASHPHLDLTRLIRFHKDNLMASIRHEHSRVKWEGEVELSNKYNSFIKGQK